VVAAVSLLWRNGYREIKCFTDEEDKDFGWVFRLAEEDDSLLRAVLMEVRPLDEDDQWGGPSLFVKDVVCFRGYEGYPPYWYTPNTTAPQTDGDAVGKKGKKK